MSDLWTARLTHEEASRCPADSWNDIVAELEQAFEEIKSRYLITKGEQP